MRFAPIVPFEYDPASFTDYHLILAHEVLENDALREYYQRLNRHVIILDNSVIELGEPLSAGELELAHSFFPASYLVLPDVIGDVPQTVELAKEWVRNRRPSRRLMVVPQGSHPKEWLECLDALVRIIAPVGEELVVGIARLTEDWEGGREFLYKEATRLGVWNGAYHLLGVQHKLEEVTWARQHALIWGVDSSLPGRAALMGLRSEEVTDLRKAPDLVTYEPRIYGEVQAEIIRVVHSVA